jgi:multicomponent Na+:H+ antiporter subunit E
MEAVHPACDDQFNPSCHDILHEQVIRDRHHARAPWNKMACYLLVQYPNLQTFSLADSRRYLMLSTPAPASVSPGAYVLGFFASLLTWVLLTGTLAADEVLLGIVVSLVVVAASGQRLALLSGLRLSPLAPLHLLRYLGYFCVQLALSNLDVARRVISPALPINPGLVEVRTRLTSDLGRMLLANSITLTPGTITVEVEGDRLLIHWIDCPPGTDLESATQAIAAGFEQRISGFLK